MIKLTINPDTQPQTLAFQKSMVSIGSGATQAIDLSLPGDGLQDVHVQITEHDGRFVATNVTNNPFVTLNHLPFWKQTLANGDRLQIDKTIIEFIGSSSTPTQTFQKVTPQILQKTNPGQQEIDDLLRQVEELEEAAELKNPNIFNELNTPEIEVKKEDANHLIETPSQQLFEPLSIEQKLTPVIQKSAGKKSDDRSSYSAKSEIEPANKQEQESGGSRWRFLLGLCISIFLIVFLSTAATYIKVRNQSHKEKIIAAEGIADVAMALTYAQVHHIQPQKQNWFDPVFLKNNLASVLSPGYPSFANIDNEGKFLNCPYILRIYTSSDLSQFLVIAQPEPGLSQWLVPKATIALDSKTMELHNIDDLKVLNRLLANTNMLDGPNAIEVSRLVHQGGIIPTASLGAKKGFAPPKTLALVRPGAENMIYNAPRYYHFGEPLLKKAATLLQNVGNSHEIIRLQQQVAELAKFPSLVLYSSQGMEKAIQAHKALATLAPNGSFIAALLNFNKEGMVASSRLLFEGDHSNMIISSLRENSSTKQELIAINDSNDNYDTHHPLLLQLMELALERKQALKTIGEEMITLLHNHVMGNSNDFENRFSILYAQYRQIDQAHSEHITQRLTALYQEHSDIPLTQFATYVRSAGLTQIAKESLNKRALEMGSKALSQDQIQMQMRKISEAKNLAELDFAVTETASMLNLANLPDSDRLILSQNVLRTLTEQQLQQFMLTPGTQLPQSEFQSENRIVLTRILKTAWITDPEACNFYLTEFEIISNQK